MLHLPHKLNFLDPNNDQNPLASRQLELSPVAADDDELIADIEGQAAARDDNWELAEAANADELAAFWTSVDDEARRDPDWVFSDDE